MIVKGLCGEHQSAITDNESKLQANPLEFFREEVDMNHKNEMTLQQVPVSLWHGTEDAIVSTELGNET